MCTIRLPDRLARRGPLGLQSWRRQIDYIHLTPASMDMVGFTVITSLRYFLETYSMCVFSSMGLKLTDNLC